MASNISNKENEYSINGVTEENKMITEEGEGEEKKKNHEVTDGPIDRGWAWMVLLGCFVIHFLAPAGILTFSILFAPYLKRFELTTTQVSWIFNLMAFLWNVSGLFAGPFCLEFGWRPVTIIGGLLLAVSFGISAFAASGVFLFFSFSILTGIGAGLAVTVCNYILPHYFQKRRGLAMAVMTSGVCIGQFAMPLIAKFLQDYYGATAAILLYSAMLFNLCVAGALFHPVEWHIRTSKKHVNIEAIQQRMSNCDVKRAAISRVRQISEAESHLGLKRETNSDGMLHRKLSRHPSKTSMHSLRSLGQLSLSLAAAPGVISEPNIDLPVEDNVENNPTSSADKCDKFLSFLSLIKRIMMTTYEHIKGLRHPSVLFLCTGGGLFLNAYVNFNMLLPLAITHLGYSLQQAAYVASATAVCNLLARLIVSPMSDKMNFSKRHIFMAGLILIAITIFISSFVTDLWILTIVMCFHGIGVGTGLCMYILSMIELVGLDKLPATFGCSSVTGAIIFIVMGTSVGAIRDSTDSYAASSQVLAASTFVSFVMWACIPHLQKWEKIKKQTYNAK